MMLFYLLLGYAQILLMAFLLLLYFIIQCIYIRFVIHEDSLDEN